MSREQELNDSAREAAEVGLDRLTAEQAAREDGDQQGAIDAAHQARKKFQFAADQSGALKEANKEGGTDPGPEPGPTPETWEFYLDRLPYSPEDQSSFRSWHIKAPVGTIAKIEVRISMMGETVYQDLSNKVAYFTRRGNNGKGVYTDMLLYVLHSGDRRMTYRQGWDVDDIPHPERPKTSCKPCRWNEEPTTELHYLGDYTDGESVATWNGQAFPGVHVVGQPQVDQNGLYFTFGGLPGSDSESSCVGVEAMLISGRITYAL